MLALSRWLAEAKALLGQVQEHFLDPTDGTFYFTANDHEELVARSKSVTESSVPSGAAVAAMAFMRLGLLCGDVATYEVGARAVRANHVYLERLPAACPALVLAAIFHLSDAPEVVIAGEPDDARTIQLLTVAQRAFPPHRVVLHVHVRNRAALAKLSPLVDGKMPLDGQPAAYVCRKGVCERPMTNADDLAATLRR